MPASARIGLVVGEPFGSFGTMLPVGHASIYLDHICPVTPTSLRLCHPGEQGVVISRYHDLTGLHLDWMAVPAAIFFYGVNDPSDAPHFVTASFEAEIRERYRQQYLLATVPDRLDRHGRAHRPEGDWAEAIGAAYDRRLFLYTVDTTPTQDAAILDYLNTKPNLRRYSLGRANCADFAADLLAFVWPSHPTRNFFADFDMTTPKNLARQADALQRTHPELNPHAYEIPQIPGTLRRSRPLRGSAETFVKTKRYLFTVLLLQPELILTDWVLYEAKGRWTPTLSADKMTLEALQAQPAHGTYGDQDQEPMPESSASTASRMLSDVIGLRAK